MNRREREQRWIAKLEEHGKCSLGSAAAVVGIASGVNSLMGDDGGGDNPGAAQAASSQASAISAEQAREANDLFAYHSQNYRPLELAAISDATKAGSPEEMETQAGRAGATVAQQYSLARRDMSRNAAMYGGPQSGAFEDNQRRMATDEAAATAGAQNNARQQERAYGLNSKVAVANVGRGIVGNAISAGGSAATGAGVAASTASTAQALQDNQSTNIGTALGAVLSGAGKLQGSYQNYQNANPGEGMYASGNGPITASQAQDAFINDSMSFRKGGLVRPRRRAPVTIDADGYKKGGAVSGPGTSTSDSVPVSVHGTPGALSNGEYVLNAKAVRHYGLKRLDRMNLKGLPNGSKMKNGQHVH